MIEYFLKTKKDFEEFESKVDIRLKDISKIVLDSQQIIFSEEEIKLVSQFFIDKNQKKEYNEQEHWLFYTYLSEAFINRFGGKYKYSNHKDDHAYLQAEVIFHKGPGIAFWANGYIQNIFKSNNPNYYTEIISESLIKYAEFEKYKAEQEERLKKRKRK